MKEFERWLKKTEDVELRNELISIGELRLMTKWHLCVAFSKIYKDEVALASLREGGGPP